VAGHFGSHRLVGVGHLVERKRQSKSIYELTIADAEVEG
jgi:hypothetical protein